MIQPCKEHPRVEINLNNGLYCPICLTQVKDYEFYRTDADREI